MEVLEKAWKSRLGYVIAQACLLTSTAASAGTATFTSEDFGKCVVKLIHEKMDSATVAKRLATSDKLRVEGAKSTLEGIKDTEDDKNDVMSSPLFKHMIPFSKQDAYEVEAFHSSPLFDYDTYHWGKGIISDNYLERLSELYRDHIPDNTSDFTIEPGFFEHLNREKPPQPREAAIGDDQPLFIKMMITASILTDRFVVSLLQTKVKQSIDPWDLVKKATDLYNGDVLMALGVIGYTFDIERVSIRDHQGNRSKRLYLGSRVKPLFSDGDVLGQNYHFWMYLNAALQGKYNSAKIMSLTYQNLVGNSKEQQADSLGLSAGDYIRNALMHPPSTYSCPLDKVSVSTPARDTADTPAAR